MKINYSLSGFGGIARVHCMGLNNLELLSLPVDFEVNFSTIATSSIEEKKSLAKKIGFDKVVSSFDELLQEDIDLVDLCTPNFVHKEEILKAIEADKHIYCEKPLALNLEETKLILEKIEKSSLKNQMGFVYRFLPAVAQAHALLKNKVIGKIKFAKIEYYHSRYLNPEVPISWRLKKESSGGGALVDLGSHMIDLSRFLLGEYASLRAWTKTFIKERKNDKGVLEKVDVDDWALLMAELKSGANATIEVSRVSPGNEGFRLHIYGDKGAIYIDSNKAEQVELYDQSPKQIEISDKMLTDDKFLKKVNSLYPSSKLSQGLMADLHLVDLIWFIESIVKDQVIAGTPNFKEGYEAQKIIEYAYKSAANNGEKISFEN